MKPPSIDDRHVKVTAYLTDETFGYEHWRAAQFSSPDVPIKRPALLILYQSPDARDAAYDLEEGPPAVLRNAQLLLEQHGFTVTKP